MVEQIDSEHSSRIPKFYEKSMPERRCVLSERLSLRSHDIDTFSPPFGLGEQTADIMVENAIGVFGLPIGVAGNFLVDGLPVIVPMAIEEPSVIAGCNNIARTVMYAGGFCTHVDAPVMRGQIQIWGCSDHERAVSEIAAYEAELIAQANRFCTSMQARGGGCTGVSARVLAQDDAKDDFGPMLSVDVTIDCRDAMGANVINKVMEGLAPTLANLVQGTVGIKILSNLSDNRLARASCEIPYALLACDDALDTGRDVAFRIVQAFRFASRDVYRACTHNKGVMNGIDAVAIATGNDWRALEAGAHAYAARSGKYKPLSTFHLDDERSVLQCSVELPLAVGVVGGSTQIHPTVQTCLKMLGPFGQSAQKLAGLMAAVGLAENLGSLKALCTEGIMRGHMALHTRKRSVEESA